MIVTHKIKMDLSRRGITPVVHMVQGDSNTRAMEISLYDNGQPWEIPEGVTAAVAFSKADGTRGLYDKLPDKSDATTLDGNTVTAILAPEVLTCAGQVRVAIVLYDAEMDTLATFTIMVVVEANPAAGEQISNNYYYLQNMEQVNAAYADILTRLDELKIEAGTEVPANAEEMKTLTIGGETFEVVDEQARKDIEELQNSSQNTDGLTAEEKSLMLSLFNNALYGADIGATKERLSALWSGEGGGGSGEAEPTTHGIVWDLVNVTSSNPVASVNDGASLSAVLTAADGYTLGDVTVTMGGEVLTGTWNSETATVTLASVTGDVVISCVGVSAETGTVTLAETADFETVGFYRPTGVFTENTTYGVTDYLDVTGCTSVTINGNIKTKSVSPAVWFDANKEFISGETADTSVFDVTVANAYTYTVPDGAVYVRCSACVKSEDATVTAERVGASDTPETDTPATSTEANTVYISPTGDDSNTGLSADVPVATFDRAKTVGGSNGTLVWMAGDYWMPEGVNLGAFAKMRTSGTVRLIYFNHKFDSAALVDGYTRVYSVDCATEITGSIWQHDVADARTEIAFADRHPLHRDRTHRLPSTRIVAVTDVDTTSTTTAEYLNTMEATTDNYLYHYDADGGKLYFTSPDADFAAHPIIKGSSTIIKGSSKEVHIRGLNILYAQIAVGAMCGVIEEVSVLGGYGGGCIIWDGASGLSLIRCEAMGADNDGINGHSSGHITCRDCWGHDNLDDGESCHDGCYITQYGGLYEHNGSGCTPATGGEAMYYGTIARNNGYTGFSAQGVEAVMMCNGCLSINNQVGFNVGGTATGTLINCVAGDNSTNFNNGKRYNCVTADTSE